METIDSHTLEMERPDVLDIDICSDVERKFVESWERPEQTEYMADLMGIDRKEALRARWRFLSEHKKCLEAANQDPIIRLWISEVEEEMDKLVSRAEIKKQVQLVENPNKVTPDMIDRAKKIPITNFVEFRHGKTVAWCHEDKRPSMFHGTRMNIAVCPVCDKKFDTIGVLMDRDHFTFAEAVRHLCTL